MILSKHPENFFPKAHLSKTHLPILIGKSPARPYSGLPDLKEAYRISGEGLCQGKECLWGWTAGGWTVWPKSFGDSMILILSMIL